MTPNEFDIALAFSYILLILCGVFLFKSPEGRDFCSDVKEFLIELFKKDAP